ncbi:MULTISPECIES: hypothetical protein [Sphingobacterium]|uniref:Uncharacterized protein n=2 Tax=Sphingobacterium multivorum TaxID=28454 RepID=A0A654BAD1_SPHMU|nr:MULTISPECIES: hypothetical protein [Sphingobacterium]VXC77268.1 conserved hypothetical protein [Sphingobacterium multivorum]HAF35626.1 hypothetical protein [Sphingobacterium sp.]HAL50654.1 hypothetical protein [Sphingobacterium sp.]
MFNNIKFHKPGQLLYCLITIAILLTSCGSSKKTILTEEDILTDTYWLRKNMEAELLYGGGDNYLRVHFQQGKIYEIVTMKGERLTGLKEEGSYTVTDNKEIVLTTKKQDQKVSYRYILANSRTLNKVSEDGSLLTNDYESYKKQ